ncbi:MAG: hypothetical protein LIR50_04265 [Bacillota bacterium]|nr:hypothetical protein [Bacillota bacterium]
MENKLNIFYMKDNYAELNCDSSFYLETNASKKVVKELVWVSEQFNNGTLEEIQEKYGNKYNEDWDKYYPLGVSICEYLMSLFKDKGYTAHEKNFETIEW